MIERYRRRKLIAFIAFLGTRLSVLLLAAVPLLFDLTLGIELILAVIMIKSACSAVAGAAWEGPQSVFAIPAFTMEGMDFAFILAFIVGLYAMHRLTLVVEGEQIGRSVVVQNLFEEIKRPIGTYTTVAGVVEILDYPLDAVRQTGRVVGGGRNDNDRTE